MALKIPASLLAGADVTNYDDTALAARVTSLETAVGDADSGLVHDVAAIAVPDVSSFVTSSDVETIITNMVNASALKE